MEYGALEMSVTELQATPPAPFGLAPVDVAHHFALPLSSQMASRTLLAPVAQQTSLF